MLHLQEEIKLHIAFCREYGLEAEDIENEDEDQGEYRVQISNKCFCMASADLTKHVPHIQGEFPSTDFPLPTLPSVHAR